MMNTTKVTATETACDFDDNLFTVEAGEAIHRKPPETDDETTPEAETKVPAESHPVVF